MAPISDRNADHFAAALLVAATARLRPTDAGVVGERVDLPDDRDLRPVPVVGRGLPDGEQPGAERLHHRLVDVAEHLGEAIAPPRPQLDRLVQVEEGVAVVALHVHDGPPVVDSGT